MNYAVGLADRIGRLDASANRITLGLQVLEADQPAGPVGAQFVR